MDEIKTAMKEKNAVALDSLRAIKSQLLLLKSSGKSAEISNDEEISLLQRLVKQRKEAAEMFSNSGRLELAENELAQIAVIEKFLPQQLSEQEVTDEISKIINSVGAKDIKDLGKVMGVASKQLLGRAEGKLISEITKKLLV